MQLSAFWPCLVIILLSLSRSNGAPVSSEIDDENSLTCGLCDRIVNVFFTAIDAGEDPDVIVNRLAILCKDLNIYSERVCRGAVGMVMPIVLYINNHTNIIRGNVCGTMLPSLNCKLSDPEKVEWSIKESTTPKPPVTEYVPPPKGSPTMKVLHLADIHWDPEYMEGSSSVCGEPLCCRIDSPRIRGSQHDAGFWGDAHKCDIPWRTVENAMAHISQQHPDIDYILWTGDLVPHNVWSTSRRGNLEVIHKLLNLVWQYFPNIPLYPTLGNHESHPVNTFAPPEITEKDLSTDWLYSDVDVEWSAWLPKETSSTIRRAGYYTTLIKPGLRLISMNMNYCYTFNWWILYNSQDPASGLLWLKQVLEEAETNGEKVHIISHVPPGSLDCWSIFSREYTKLVNRFESTITAQFFGHTHYDEFKVFYDDKEPSRPTNVAFLGCGLTTFYEMNPGYKIYTIDGQRPNSTWSVLDHSSWIMNLTASNQDLLNPPVWRKLYDSQTEYNLTSSSPKEMDSFYHRMVNDDKIFQLYYKNYFKAGDAALSRNCDSKCKKSILCKTVTTNIWDERHCL